MNWTATVNEGLVEWPIQRKHHFMGEVCEYVGECAVREGASVLIDALERFISQLERLNADCKCVDRGWIDACQCPLHREQAESANRRY